MARRCLKNYKPSLTPITKSMETMVGELSCSVMSTGHLRNQRVGRDNRDTDNPLILAVCTSLMARAHQMLRQASERFFCDSTASLDRYNCPTFFMSTSCSARGIPLGVVITSGEGSSTLTESFSYLKSIVPPCTFYGKGNSGPTLLITDDSEAERGALREIRPSSTQLLCIFHYLQSWWTWLWDGKHGIHKEDRYPIMLLVRKLVYVTD